MNFLTFTKVKDGFKIYVQIDDIISVEQMENYSIVHLIYGSYEVQESVNEIFKKNSNHIKFSSN